MRGGGESARHYPEPLSKYPNPYLRRDLVLHVHVPGRHQGLQHRRDRRGGGVSRAVTQHAQQHVQGAAAEHARTRVGGGARLQQLQQQPAVACRCGGRSRYNERGVPIYES